MGMMDPTTARDRLTEWAINGGLYNAADLRSDVTEVLRALAGAPPADVAATPTLNRDGYDEECVLHAARTFADGGQVGHPSTVVAELLAMIERRDALLAAAPEGVDAADEPGPREHPCPTVRELDGDTTEEKR